MQSGIVGCIIFRIIAWTQVLALSRASFRQSLASTDLGSRSGAAFGSFGESPNNICSPVVEAGLARIYLKKVSLQKLHITSIYTHFKTKTASQ